MTGTASTPFTGELIDLAAGDYRARIAAVGAAVQSLTLAGRDLILPAPVDAPNAEYRGALVAPWPNRLADGDYTWHGADHHVPVTEASTRTALHGLTCFTAFTVRERAADRAALHLDLVPSPGYPFPLSIDVEHILHEEQGLTTRVTAHHIDASLGGGAPAPYGVCPHPYLVAGTDDAACWSLDLPARRVLAVDDRKLPADLLPASALLGAEAADGALALADTALDHAFTDLTGGRVAVHSPAGTGAAIAFDHSRLPWVQVCTSGTAVAVEPMTCPPNAFATGTDVIAIDAGDTVLHEWTIDGW